MKIGELVIHRFRGQEVAAHLDDLARLRIEVFREFPYLYDGDMAYERRYLATYGDCPESFFVLVEDQGRIVGGSSGLPLTVETPEIQAPWIEKGWDRQGIFYFGESVLLPAYRGRGLGHVFFDQRETFARELGGFTHAAFCAVQRPEDHPRHPNDYRPLDAFWRKRGYAPRPELVAHLSWKDLDEAESSPKPLVFWLGSLA
ncbi:MAG: GNAT family N-acetyltransferase [Phycisphaeraceae bacterium]|nr:GNAT family N-acetyltransferase [Phycisphaeraceae bacterium]